MRDDDDRSQKTMKRKRQRQCGRKQALAIVSLGIVIALVQIHLIILTTTIISPTQKDHKSLVVVPLPQIQNVHPDIIISSPIKRSEPPPKKPKLLPQWNPGKQQYQTTPQRPDGGAFVHLGKTGGSTLSVSLVNGCHSFIKHPCRNISIETETPASRLIHSYYHVPDFAFLQQSRHDFLIVTVRDPLDRTVSAFVYEHILNRQARNETIDPHKLAKYQAAYTCFPTLERFVQYLGVGNESTVFDYPYHKREVHPYPCQDFARAALHGYVKVYNHFYFGYNRIRSFLQHALNANQHQQEPLYYVARQEHLWKDWNEINRLLAETFEKNRTTTTTTIRQLKQGVVQQPQTTVENNKNRRNTTAMELQHKLPVTRTLSAAGIKSLCCALHKEYEAYFWFLRHAQNLQPADIQFSLQRAKERCGAHLKNMDQLLYDSVS